MMSTPLGTRFRVTSPMLMGFFVLLGVFFPSDDMSYESDVNIELRIMKRKTGLLLHRAAAVC